jgi:hypothetical protein
MRDRARAHRTRCEPSPRAGRRSPACGPIEAPPCRFRPLVAPGVAGATATTRTEADERVWAVSRLRASANGPAWMGGERAVTGERAVNERLVSQTEAARLAGCSRDTIVRARRSGRFPNARLVDHQWSIPTEDLIASGLYHPVGRSDDPVLSSPSEGETPPPGATEPAAVELARAQARVAALEDVVARQDDELRFLRLTVDTLARRGAP